MSDSNNDFLLQKIYDEQQQIRKDLSETKTTVLTKIDFAEYRVVAKEAMDVIKEEVVSVNEILLLIKSAVEKNTNFRKSFVNGSKYLFGSVFVAILGIVSAIVPSMINQHNIDKAAVSAATTPSPTPSVFLLPTHPIKIHLPH